MSCEVALSTGDGRYDGGQLTITGEGAATKIGWTAPGAREPERANTARRVIETARLQLS